MRFLGYMLLIVLAGFAGFIGARQGQSEATIVARESAYDRIMRTGIIRCGYMDWMPAIGKDPNTGQIRGIVYEVAEALAAAAELKIEWAEEINVGTYMQDLNNGRYDMECAGGWPNTVRGKHIYYSRPFAFFPLVPFVRAGDTRFDAGIETLKQPGITAAVVDGDTNQIFRRAAYPDMKELTLPQLASVSDYLLAVASGKADITFGDYVGGVLFLQNNPGKLRALPYHLRLVPQSFSFASGEDKLKNMMDAALLQLMADGTIGRILDKYETVPGLFVRAKVD
jgi:ABC-type amino acid transport substrate-binding protein